MALAALIVAYHESAEPGVPLRALLPLAGRTLVERQAKLAAAAGAAPVVILVERMPGELTDAIDRLRRDRLEIVVARSAGEAAEAVDPEDELLVVGDGFIGDAAHFSRAAKAGAPAVLTVPDSGHDDRFERIDAQSRWAGLALIHGELLDETAAILRDWDLQSTLLRRAVQSGARHIRAEGEVAIVEREVDLGRLQRRILDSAGAPRGGWASRFILGPIERAATAALMGGAVTPQAMGTAAAALTGLGALAFARGALWVGLLLLLAATPLDGIAERIARLRLEAPTGDSWWCHLLPIFAGGALVALGYALSAEQGWGMILLALTAITFLLAQRFETGGEEVARGSAFVADRKNMAWLLLPFALLGAWEAGLAILFAYAAGSFFWTQNQVHAAQSRPPQD